MRGNNNFEVWLHDIVESAILIEGYIGHLSREEFFNSVEKQDSVARRLAIIGEAVQRLPEDFKNRHPEIPWAKAAGMRNVLIHEYFDVDDDLVWKTLTESLPEFKRAIEQLITYKKP